MLLYLFPELEEALGLKLHNTLNAENDSIKRKVSMTLLLVLIVCLPLKRKHPRELKNPEQVFGPKLSCVRLDHFFDFNFNILSSISSCQLKKMDTSITAG